MARDFDGVDDQGVFTASSPVTAYPMSMAVRINIDSGGSGDMRILGVTEGTTLNDIIGIALNDTFVYAQSYDGGNSVAQVSKTTGQWTTAVATFASISNRKIYHAGSNATNTATRTAPASLDRVHLGFAPWDSGNQEFNGGAADAAIWNVELTADEAAAYDAGVSPLLIRPHALVFYAPLMGNISPEPDLIGKRNLTLTGTPAQTTNPAIYYPVGNIIQFPASAAAPARRRFVITA